MIPTLMVAGLVFGRWWRVAPVVAAVGWALLLAVKGIIQHAAGPLAAAAGLAAVNTAAGVAVNRTVVWLWRRAPRHRAGRWSRQSGAGGRR